jgi:hypothetical protein
MKALTAYLKVVPHILPGGTEGNHENFHSEGRYHKFEKSCSVNLGGRDHMTDLGVHERIPLKLIIQNGLRRHRLG